MHRLLNLQAYTGFAYFRKYDRVLNMRQDAIKEGFSKYTRISNMLGFCICKRYTRF